MLALHHSVDVRDGHADELISMHRDRVLFSLNVGLNVLQAISAAKILRLRELVDDVIGHQGLLDRRNVRDVEELLLGERLQTFDKQVLSFVAADIITIPLQELQRRNAVGDKHGVIQIPVKQMTEVFCIIRSGNAT